MNPALAMWYAFWTWFHPHWIRFLLFFLGGVAKVSSLCYPCAWPCLAGLAGWLGWLAWLAGLAGWPGWLAWLADWLPALEAPRAAGALVACRFRTTNRLTDPAGRGDRARLILSPAAPRPPPTHHHSSCRLLSWPSSLRRARTTT